MKKYFFVFSLIVLFSAACRKEQQGVPYAYVNLTVYVNDPQHISLTTIGGWKYFSGGYGGLIIYRKSQSEFMVYDRACPVNPDDAGARIEVDPSNIILKDASCESQFLISDGSTIGGPAVVPLQRYTAIFDGTVLRVNN
ncbi:MAG TPA: hypothetical protein VK826_05005 [Bacteroidia bacterium]|nr:hypothetical protein [Bacteroidia bacterium]